MGITLEPIHHSVAYNRLAQASEAASTSGKALKLFQQINLDDLTDQQRAT